MDARTASARQHRRKVGTRRAQQPKSVMITVDAVAMFEAARR